MKIRLNSRLFCCLNSKTFTTTGLSSSSSLLSSLWVGTARQKGFFQQRLIRMFSSFSHDNAEALLQNNQASSSEVNDKTKYFKMAMRKVPQQVVVVTSSQYQPLVGKWLKRGVTCSSFCSVSINPPIIAFCLMQGSRMDSLLKSSNKFAVHILAQDQIHQGLHFSKPTQDEVCQFDNVPHVDGDGSLPIILGSLAVLMCDTHLHHAVGDNTVWYGNVNEVSVSETLQEPLIYFTRKFRSIGDEIFLKAFEDTTLPFENWTHEAHLRMAWNYIKDYGKEGAVPYIKLGIQKFNEKNMDKIKTGYHETITMFFIHLVSDAIVRSVHAEETFEEFLSRHSHLVSKDLLLEYYSQEVLFQDQAKNRFIKPDKKSLP